MKKFCVALLTIAVLFTTACGQKAPTWQEQYDLGVRYLEDGNYEEAIIAFTAAIEIDPKQAPAYVGRGDAYIGSGETEENLAAAQADYEMAIELDETNADAYLGLADVFIRQGEYEKAWEILQNGYQKTGDTTIADKISEIESGSYMDSSQHIRRKNSFNVDGDIESYTIYSYDHLGRRSGWENWTKNQNSEKLYNRCVVIFNEQNMPERNQFYDGAGNLEHYDTFIYNTIGQKIEQHRYDAAGEAVCYFLYYYNEMGQQSRYEGYEPDGTLYSYWISEYNDAGELIRKTMYDPDGTITGYEQYE